MARAIKEGQSIYIPFVDGESVFDSQNRPRIYKSVEQFKRKYPAFRIKKPKLVEYAPVVYAKWEYADDVSSGHVENIYTCSACKNYYAWGEMEKTPYCPSCGAKIDLEE